VILDFSGFRDQKIKTILDNSLGKEFIHSIHKNPEFGLCKNLNFYHDIAKDYKWAFYLNDDAFIHEKFILNAIMLGENNSDIGFIGGVPQKAGWLANPENYEIPKADVFRIEEIEDLRKLQWEFSACLFRMETWNDAGNFDEFFDPIGLCSDNDWLIRAQKAAWRTVRYGGCPFWHGKGVTQSRFRLPNAYDPLKDRAAEYLKEKWNLDIYGPGEQTIESCFEKEFNE
jgi:GT2 family glycosyltransferase